MAFRVYGHGLRDGGKPWLADDCTLDRCATNWRGNDREQSDLNASVSGPGHAQCQCGWQSDHLPNGAARRRSHLVHKVQMAQDKGLPVPEEILAQLQPVDATG